MPMDGQGTPEAMLRASFPEQADQVLGQEEGFVAKDQGFALEAEGVCGGWRGRSIDVELPREGSGVIRFRVADSGFEVRVREIGVEWERAIERTH